MSAGTPDECRPGCFAICKAALAQTPLPVRLSIIGCERAGAEFRGQKLHFNKPTYSIEADISRLAGSEVPADRLRGCRGPDLPAAFPRDVVPAPAHRLPQRYRNHNRSSAA